MPVTALGWSVGRRLVVGRLSVGWALRDIGHNYIVGCPSVVGWLGADGDLVVGWVGALQRFLSALVDLSSFIGRIATASLLEWLTISIAAYRSSASKKALSIVVGIMFAAGWCASLSLSKYLRGSKKKA